MAFGADIPGFSSRSVARPTLIAVNAKAMDDGGGHPSEVIAGEATVSAPAGEEGMVENRESKSAYYA